MRKFMWFFVGILFAALSTFACNALAQPKAPAPAAGAPKKSTAPAAPKPLPAATATQKDILKALQTKEGQTVVCDVASKCKGAKPMPLGCGDGTTTEAPKGGLCECSVIAPDGTVAADDEVVRQNIPDFKKGKMVQVCRFAQNYLESVLRRLYADLGALKASGKATADKVDDLEKRIAALASQKLDRAEFTAEVARIDSDIASVTERVVVVEKNVRFLRNNRTNVLVGAGCGLFGRGGFAWGCGLDIGLEGTYDAPVGLLSFATLGINSQAQSGTHARVDGLVAMTILPENMFAPIVGIHGDQEEKLSEGTHDLGGGIDAVLGLRVKVGPMRIVGQALFGYGRNTNIQAGTVDDGFQGGGRLDFLFGAR